VSSRGTVVAVARSVGSRQPRAEYRWALGDVQLARQVEPESVEADELQLQARELVEVAREYGELSLAERVLREREMDGRRAP
jgi:hypothetical protein